jgi:hypothetical protein
VAGAPGQTRYVARATRADAVSALIGYRETLPPDDTTGALVAVAVTMAAGELGIPRPTIRYFDEDHRNYVPGWTRPAFYDALLEAGRLLGICSAGGGTVHVSDRLRQSAAIEVAAHEVRHVYQKHRPLMFDGVDTELDADLYAKRFVDKFNKRGR